MINSCINPLVYTTTIPAFKELVNGLLSCNLARKLGAMSETSEMDSMTRTMRKTLNQQGTLQSKSTENLDLSTMYNTLNRQKKIEESKHVSINETKNKP